MSYVNVNNTSLPQQYIPPSLSLGRASLWRRPFPCPCVGLAAVQTVSEFGMAPLAANKPRRTRKDNECARDDNVNADDDDIR